MDAKTVFVSGMLMSPPPSNDDQKDYDSARWQSNFLINLNPLGSNTIGD
jgi:hypothetical protein